MSRNINYNGFLIISSLVLILTSCKESSILGDNRGTNRVEIILTNPVLPGDFADPSLVRVGENYWATATSSEWAPLFPILNSKNLEDWEIQTHVFPDSIPEWAEAHFWAPEIAYDNGKFFVYYTAKKKGGPLCVGVASSKSPKGPYVDHGPIICQDAGAIDGFQIRDEKGSLFLIWKEDGNSRGEATPIWGQEMNEERTELIGEKFELFRNDPLTWEGNLVEGAYLIKKGNFYYAFYSGDACCGRGCTYGIGVARSENLRGPWEKYDNNPIKRENQEWKCAGHGSMVETEEGRYFFLYHAYSKNGFVYTGRQGLIDEVIWGENGWPKFLERSSTPSALVQQKKENVVLMEDFNGFELSKNWQWPVKNRPQYSMDGNSLLLEPKVGNLGAVLAQRTLSPDYEAIAAIKTSSNSHIHYGIAAIGDQRKALGISYSNREIILWKVKDGKEEIIDRKKIADYPKLFLKMEVKDGERYSFFWSEEGENWKGFEEVGFLNGKYLPPWDRAVRVGLFSKGESSAKAVFDSFKMDTKTEREVK